MRGNYCDQMIGIENADHLALARVLDELIKLHLIIADQFIARRIAPGAQARDALAMAVNSRTSVDVNTKLFDIIGRIAMTGFWVIWLAEQQQGVRTDAIASSLGQFFEIGMSIIENNGALRLPVSDDQTTDIALFGLFCLHGAPDGRRLTSWLTSMVERYDLSIRSRSRYPTSFSEYADLVAHPRHKSDEYFKEATAGSTLVPFLASWAVGLGCLDLATRLATLRSDKLQHCTMQLWTPGEDSEEHLYINSDIHGRAICDLPILDEGKDLLETIADACTDERGFQALSAARTSMWPIILLACRHWRLPVPPNFYIESLRTFFAQNNGAGRGDEPSQPADGLREAKE